MLQHLYIKNYALIRELDIHWPDGFSVITGETGAGKSIILGALGLVMGDRADTKAITEGEERCIIEATFHLKDNPTAEQELIIRRELNQNGRSRSFVNDEVVTQTELRALASKLIDIHSQHENLLLSEEDYQLGVVDALASNQKEREAYALLYTNYCEQLEALHELEQQAKKAQADQDYIQFQYQQLEQLHPVADEVETLEEEQFMLSHAESIQQTVQENTYLLQGDEHSILDILHGIHMSEVDDELEERLRSAEIELKDICQEIERIGDRIEINPSRLEAVEQRLDQLNTMMRKHHVDSVEALIEIRDTLEQQCNRLDSYDEEIAALRQSVQETQAKAIKAAEVLSRTRRAVGAGMAKELIEGLKKLGVQHPNIQVEQTTLPEMTATGLDKIDILFAANLNQTMRPVREVASGGEISRLMLCIKALTAAQQGLSTILFDEVDTGVSGEVASQMGHIMQQMSKARQIITITHLPQIAALGDTQMRVYKEDNEQRTETHIELLTQEGRINEIAKMLSGNHPTEAARENAKQLLLSGKR